MQLVHVDMITMIFVLVVVNLVSAGFYLAYIRLTKPRTPMRFFIGSKAIQGLSWFLRLLVLGGANAALVIVCDVTMTFGFALESILFVHFMGRLRRRMRLFYLLSLGFVLVACVVLWQDAGSIRNIILLAAYLTYMMLAAWSLLFSRDATVFQRVIGVCYGLIPLASVILYVSVLPEVTAPGHPTSLIGLLYYISILTMQIIGSVGFLLVLGERDEQRLLEIASRDALTGIFNRKAFFERAEVLYERAWKERHATSALMLDIDLFKGINDEHGHQVGDRVIRHLCETVLSTIRRGDLFARFGGEEFVVFLPDTGETEAKALATRIHEAVHRHRVEPEGDLPAYSISMGVSAGIPSSTDRIDALLADCDQAMYHCKQHGRDCVAYKPAGGHADEILQLCQNGTCRGME